MLRLVIGIDDTDSVWGGCTTHVAATLVPELLRKGSVFLDYPRIVRLNPNVPFKTRGNGAVALEISIPEDKLEEVKDVVEKVVLNESDLSNSRTDPCIVFSQNGASPRLAAFTKKCMYDLVSPSEAFRVARKEGVVFRQLKGPRGIVGALAAVGERLEGDHTFELLAYRSDDYTGSPRRIEEKSVVRMAEETGMWTFNCYCPEARRILITPRGPDPVLYGIRGNSPEAVKLAASSVQVEEPINSWMIFRTNHGTDAHFVVLDGQQAFLPFRPFGARGYVKSHPMISRGGHVYFDLQYKHTNILCAAYEQTLGFRRSILQLVPGDLIEVYGGVRRASRNHSRTLNLEKLRVLRLVSSFRAHNPRCHVCSRSMESAGQGQNYRCRRCRTSASKDERVVEHVRRDLRETIYLPADSAHRHLTKPYSRYGNERSGIAPMIEGWFGTGSVS